MFALLFTVLVTLPPNTGFNMSSVLSDLRKTMDSFDLIPDNLDLFSDARPPPPLLEDSFNTQSPLVFLPDPDRRSDQQKLKLVLDVIVQYNTHSDFDNHHRIWELYEDTYLINLCEPNFFLVKCTLKQAFVFTPAQISLLKIATREQSDQNKVVLQLGLLIAKYDDLAPCAFKIIRDEENGIKNFDSVFQLQSLTLKFLIEQSPLLPKTVQKRLQEDYDALRRQHCRRVDPQQEPKLKRIICY